MRPRVRALIVAACVSVAAATASAQRSSRAVTTAPSGRLSTPQDLGLVEGGDRALWQKPEQIMDIVGIADGSVVADLGAAGGWFTSRLADRVGPNGLVYAEDIQPLMLDLINRRIARENRRNVRTVLGTANDPRLPAGIDAIMLIDVYTEMQIPPANPVVLLKNAARSLKRDGRVGVVDFNPGGGGPGPAASERVDPETVITAATEAGLKLVMRDPHVNAFQYLLVFARAD